MTHNNSKERLFEVMGKVNGDFNNSLNEVFGWSKKEKEGKANQQQIDAAKQEAQEYNFNRFMFQPGGQENMKQGKTVRINGVKQELPEIAALIPELFDTNQGAVEINSKYDVPTYVPLKWANLILNQNREIDPNVAIENINNLLDRHSQKMGLREDDVINEDNGLTSTLKSAIANVDPNLSVYDLANAIGDILIDDYGSHNYEVFMTTIHKKLEY